MSAVEQVRVDLDLVEQARERWAERNIEPLSEEKARLLRTAFGDLIPRQRKAA